MSNTHSLSSSDFAEFHELPNRGPFAGREHEINKLTNFLQDQTPSAQSIILIHGPRGIGKSSLALKAANEAGVKGKFKAILWMHRSRAEELAIGGPEKSVFSSVTANIAVMVETPDFPLHLLYFPKETTNTLPKGYGEYLRNILTRQRPYLLIIDDFDDSPPGQDDELFRQLAQIKSPNKVILTSRSPKIHFPNPVFRLMEVSPLIREDVAKIVFDCHADKFSNVQPLEDIATQIWSVSGGHPEFIVQFMAQLFPQRRWSLGQEREWIEIYKRFSAGYLTQTKQESDPEVYLRDSVYQENLEIFKKQIVNWDSNHKYVLLDVLFALANRPIDSPLIPEQTLAHDLGFLLDEHNSFFDAIEELRRFGVIGCRRLLSDNNKQEIWQPLIWPFARDFVREQLAATGQVDSLQQRCADRWTRFLLSDTDESRLNDQQIPNIYSSFRWCVDRADWHRVLGLGKLFSLALWFFKGGKAYQETFSEIQYVCEQTIEAVQRLALDDPSIICQQYVILARLYSDADSEDVAKLDIALWYAKKAFEVIGDIYSDSWEEVACLIAKLYAKRGQIAEAKDWLMSVIHEGKKEFGSLPDWAMAAYKISQLNIRAGDANQAQEWLDKALSSYRLQKNPSACAHISVEFAYACLLNNDLDRASKYAQMADSVAVGLYSDTSLTEYAEVSALSNAILAEVAKNKNRIDQCEEYLRQARDLSKSAHLNPKLIDELNGWLEHIIRSTRGFMPASTVMTILDRRLTWGKSAEENAAEGMLCPVCRRGVVDADGFDKQIWVCTNRNCQIAFHVDCLIAIGGQCSSCGTIATFGSNRFRT